VSKKFSVELMKYSMTWIIQNIKGNDMSTTFLQQILSGKLLLVVIIGQKNNLSVSLKFEPIITNHLWFIEKYCRRKISQTLIDTRTHFTRKSECEEKKKNIFYNY